MTKHGCGNCGGKGTEKKVCQLCDYLMDEHNMTNKDCKICHGEIEYTTHCEMCGGLGYWEDDKSW